MCKGKERGLGGDGFEDEIGSGFTENEIGSLKVMVNLGSETERNDSSLGAGIEVLIN